MIQICNSIGRNMDFSSFKFQKLTNVHMFFHFIANFKASIVIMEEMPSDNLIDSANPVKISSQMGQSHLKS